MSLTTNSRVAISLVRPVSRAIDWVPFAAVLVVTIGLAAATGDQVRPYNLAATVRLSALLLGAAAGFALVDVATDATAATPVPRWLRQWTRTVLAFAAAMVAWGAVFAVLASRSMTGTELGTGGYLLEASICVSTGLACTAAVVRQRSADRSSAVFGAAVLLAVAASTLFYPGRVWPLPMEPDWVPVHDSWLFFAPVPLAVLVVANTERHRQRR